MSTCIVTASLLLAACQSDTPPTPPPTPDSANIETVVTAGARAPSGVVMPAPVKNLAGGAPRMTRLPAPGYWQPAVTSKFPETNPNPVVVTAEQPVSTFSIDVDTASYGVVRDALNHGALPPADAVRIEEMVNYFDYAYALPTDRKTPFRASLAVYPAPWNKDTEVLHIGIKGFDIPKKERPRANLVFLIDTSGSMNEPNKLPLLISSFRLLVDQLRDNDRVSIVAYAGSAGVVLPPTPGSDKAKILAALDQLHAGGSTAGGEGIRLAYSLAEANFVKGGVNRVLLATDGDFNVGITDPKALEDFVVRERDTGVYLTCLGFGNDNYQDATMQKLAQAGNGNAAFIDTLNEAHKVFVDQISGTLFTIANDVKIQIEFNPARIAEYRLIGYETRMLNETDFKNDKVDAGDIGSGTTVTALYELTPVGSPALMSDPHRYGKKPAGDPKGELGFLKIRYKLPGEKVSRLIERPITDADMHANFAAVPAEMRFAAAVAGAAQLMRHDPYIKDFSYDRAKTIATEARGSDTFGYRAEFIRMLDLAKAAAAQAPLNPASGGE
ncbi:MAG: VWA domain-containing protein [Proteobacteria bacterium]|nr:VWA domain-containing protein [Pseudomonadota bacterium]